MREGRLGLLDGPFWVFLDDSHRQEGQGGDRGWLVLSSDRFAIVQKLPSGNTIGTHSLFFDWAHSFPEIITQYQSVILF